MKVLIVGAVCAVLGGIVGGLIGGELVGRSMPSDGDLAAIKLTGSYGRLAGRQGALLEPSDVRSRALTDFANDFINTGASFSHIADESLRRRATVIAKEALDSGLFRTIPEADLRNESVAWAECMKMDVKADRDLPECVRQRKSKGAPAA